MTAVRTFTPSFPASVTPSVPPAGDDIGFAGDDGFGGELERVIGHSGNNPASREPGGRSVRSDEADSDSSVDPTRLVMAASASVTTPTTLTDTSTLSDTDTDTVTAEDEAQTSTGADQLGDGHRTAPVAGSVVGSVVGSVTAPSTAAGDDPVSGSVAGPSVAAGDASGVVRGEAEVAPAFASGAVDGQGQAAAVGNAQMVEGDPTGISGSTAQGSGTAAIPGAVSLSGAAVSGVAPGVAGFNADGDSQTGATGKSTGVVETKVDPVGLATTSQPQSAQRLVDAATPEAMTAPRPTGFDLSTLGEGIAGRIRTGDKVRSISLDLHPAELGGVRIDVRQIDGVTHLVLTPDRQVGGHRLAAAMADLRHDLEQAGVNVGDLQLRQDSTGSGQGRRGSSDDSETTVGPALSRSARKEDRIVEPRRRGRSQGAVRVAIDL